VVNFERRITYKCGLRSDIFFLFYVWGESLGREPIGDLSRGSRSTVADDQYTKIVAGADTAVGADIALKSGNVCRFVHSTLSK
jgi:hypothetical protein